MALRICAVFHSDKQDGAAGKPRAVAVNPPMTMTGMVKIDSLVEKIRDDPRLTMGMFDALYSSRLARALDAASVLALHFDMDIETVEHLGQMANKEGNEVIKYPGYEDEDVVVWQQNAMTAVRELNEGFHDETNTIVIVSHRPIIGGLVAWARGVIGQHDAIDKIVKDPELVKDGYVVFDYEPDDDRVSEIPL